MRCMNSYTLNKNAYQYQSTSFQSSIIHKRKDMWHFAIKRTNKDLSGTGLSHKDIVKGHADLDGGND